MLKDGSTWTRTNQINRFLKNPLFKKIENKAWCVEKGCDFALSFTATNDDFGKIKLICHLFSYKNPFP